MTSYHNIKQTCVSKYSHQIFSNISTMQYLELYLEYWLQATSIKLLNWSYSNITKPQESPIYHWSRMFDWIIPPNPFSIYSLFILTNHIEFEVTQRWLYYIMIPASNCTMSPIFSWNIQIFWVVGYVVGDIWYRYSAMNSVSLHLSSILLHTQPFTINMLLCFLLFEIVFYYSLEVFRNFKN